MSQSSHPAVVHDAVGPDLPLIDGLACIALGVVSLLLAGVLPAVLGALVDEHRLSASGIGLVASFEALSMGLSTAVASTWLPATRLKLIALIALLALILADYSTIHASGFSVIIARAAAGVPEGILLWIMTSMIARTRTPERWAGIFFTVSDRQPVRHRVCLCARRAAAIWRRRRLRRSGTARACSARSS